MVAGRCMLRAQKTPSKVEVIRTVHVRGNDLGKVFPARVVERLISYGYWDGPRSLRHAFNAALKYTHGSRGLKLYVNPTLSGTFRHSFDHTSDWQSR